jgi:hypothetical protein
MGRQHQQDAGRNERACIDCGKKACGAKSLMREASTSRFLQRHRLQGLRSGFPWPTGKAEFEPPNSRTMAKLIPIYESASEGATSAPTDPCSSSVTGLRSSTNRR